MIDYARILNEQAHGFRQWPEPEDEFPKHNPLMCRLFEPLRGIVNTTVVVLLFIVCIATIPAAALYRWAVGVLYRMGWL